MFTGIVQGIGSVRGVEPRGGDVTLWIDTGSVPLSDVQAGGSIAVSGACLTAVQLEPHAFAADVSRETLSLTTAASGPRDPRQPGEGADGRPGAGRALRHRSCRWSGASGVAHDDARSVRVEFEVPEELARYVARKGSICVDGVSLTVNGVSGRRST